MATKSFSTVWIYLTIALFLLLIISFTPSRPHRPHRRLKLRSVSELASSPPPGRERHIPFDPIIADIERRRVDREWERAHFFPPDSAPAMEAQPEWEDFMDAEDYINDEERFNITHRIVLLFPKIDVGPADGFVTSDELTEWNLQQAEKEVMHRTKRDMEIHDKNHDGFISFKEYEPPSWAFSYHHDDNSTEVGWWKEEHFNASDADGDGLLNLTEFKDFLHPADTSNPKLNHWLCKEEIRERDKDRDGKLSFQEYFNGLFDSIRNYDEDHNSSLESEISSEAPAKKLFSHLDEDKDGFLSADELKPVIGDLHPSERFYAKQQADYLVSQADMDKDGRLTLKEMIDNPYVFYSAIFSEEDDYGFHDEFR